MSFWQTELLCAFGVSMSFIVPVLAREVRNDWPTRAEAQGGKVYGVFGLIESVTRGVKAVYPTIRKYLKLVVFSLLVSFLIALALQEQLTTFKAAFFAGYIWDSTLQKITGRP